MYSGRPARPRTRKAATPSAPKARGSGSRSREDLAARTSPTAQPANTGGLRIPARFLGGDQRGRERAAGLGALGEVAGAMEGVKRVAGHEQVEDGPHEGGRDGRARHGDGAPAAAAGGDEVERIAGREQPPLGPEQPGEPEE
jgi:hypothetical protein